MFECVDRNPDSVPGSAANTRGAVFYPEEANSNGHGMPSPPYNRICPPYSYMTFLFLIATFLKILTLPCIGESNW